MGLVDPLPFLVFKTTQSSNFMLKYSTDAYFSNNKSYEQQTWLIVALYLHEITFINEMNLFFKYRVIKISVSIFCFFSHRPKHHTRVKAENNV